MDQNETSPFGAESLYYSLYRADPANARKELWDKYLDMGKSIRAAARAMGCSRNTARDVVRRVNSELSLHNRSSLPSVPRKARTRRLGSARMIAIPASVAYGGFSTRERSSIGFLLMKTSAGPVSY